MNKKLKPTVSCSPYLYHGVVGFKGGIAKIEKKLTEKANKFQEVSAFIWT